MEDEITVVQLAHYGPNKIQVIRLQKDIRLFFGSGSSTAFQLRTLSARSGASVRDIVARLVQTEFIVEVLGNEPAK